jgi:hypothetical protein
MEESGYGGCDAARQRRRAAAVAAAWRGTAGTEMSGWRGKRRWRAAWARVRVGFGGGGIRKKKRKKQKG